MEESPPEIYSGDSSSDDISEDNSANSQEKNTKVEV